MSSMSGMTSDCERMQQDIHMCKMMIDALKQETKTYEGLLESTRTRLQSVCQHKYVSQLEEDGHTTVRWYVCTECERATRLKSEVVVGTADCGDMR